MAIQNRRGDYEDFRPEKMVSGEMAVVLSGDPASISGRSMYVCFEPGHVKRITTYEDFENELQAAAEEIQEAFTDDIRNAISAAVTATAAADEAVAAANVATEAANAAAEAAGDYVLGDISEKTVDFTEAEVRENIARGESVATLFGKIKKWFADLKEAAFATIANNLTTTGAGSVLDARQGKALDDKLTELNGKLQWQLIGSVTGSATISADLTSYQEIMCVAKSGVSTLIYTAYFPAQILTGTESTITMTGVCFKTTYGLSQKTGVVKANKYGISLGYLYETTVTETPSNTVDRASFAVYAR